MLRDSVIRTVTHFLLVVLTLYFGPLPNLNHWLSFRPVFTDDENFTISLRFTKNYGKIKIFLKFLKISVNKNQFLFTKTSILQIIYENNQSLTIFGKSIKKLIFHGICCDFFTGLNCLLLFECDYSGKSCCILDLSVKMISCLIHLHT